MLNALYVLLFVLILLAGLFNLAIAYFPNLVPINNRQGSKKEEVKKRKKNTLALLIAAIIMALVEWLFPGLSIPRVICGILFTPLLLEIASKYK